MIQTMENKPLYISPTKRIKGLVVYCYKCNRDMVDTCKLTGKSLKLCPNGEKHVYKVIVHIPGTRNERRTKNLETRNLDEAIKQALEFKKEVKEGRYQKTNSTENTKGNNQPQLLIQVLARYVGWLRNEGVPAHKIKVRSEEHIKDVERACKILAQCFKSNGHNLSTLSINDLNDDIVGEIYTYLEDKEYANRTFNKIFGFYSSILKWYGEEYRVPIINWFEEVERKKLNPKPEAITKTEYEALLKQITPENGIKKYENGVKPTRNLYRPWLKDGIRLALETGRRREELINLKWNKIIESEGDKFIKVEDFKVNHIQRRNTEDEKKFIYIPVTESLLRLLKELGYEKYENTDNYILAPEIKIKRKRFMSDNLSRGFSHFYDQLGTGRKLTLKCLRKTYITYLKIYMGDGNIKSITGHSDNRVIDDSYTDDKEIAKAVARRFSMFSNESGRVDDLKEVRTSTKGNNLEKDLEV